MNKSFLVICCILVQAALFGQTFTGVPVDSVCTVVYDGKMWLPPPPPPPLPPHLYDSLKQAELISNYRKKISDMVGEVDTTKEMTHFSRNVIDENGKFNPTIIWESKKCYDLNSLEELEKILACEKKAERLANPANCFDPRHSVLLYKNDKVVAHYDICFRCNRVKFNREEYMHCIDMYALGDFLIQQGYSAQKIKHD